LAIYSEKKKSCNGRFNYDTFLERVSHC